MVSRSASQGTWSCSDFWQVLVCYSNSCGSIESLPVRNSKPIKFWLLNDTAGALCNTYWCTHFFSGFGVILNFDGFGWAWLGTDARHYVGNTHVLYVSHFRSMIWYLLYVSTTTTIRYLRARPSFSTPQTVRCDQLSLIKNINQIWTFEIPRDFHNRSCEREPFEYMQRIKTVITELHRYYESGMYDVQRRDLM